VAVIEVAELCGCFQNLLSVFEVAESFETGTPLIRLVQEHWEVFDDSLDEDTQVKLLEEIANAEWDDDDGEPKLNATELYSPPGLTRILDLTKKTDEINPFTTESLKRHVEIGDLLDGFAEEMSRPERAPTLSA
jgi:hypothetical protein